MSRKHRPPSSAGAQVSQAIQSLPESAVTELASLIRTGAKEQSLLLHNPGVEPMMIPVALSPWVVSREAARYMQTLFRGIRRTVNRILQSYFEDPRLQNILPLRESELNWFKASSPDGIPRLQTVFERFDTNLGFGVEPHLDSFQIIEFNAVGVGCIHMMPAATELLKAHLLPRLKEMLPDVSLVAPSDYRRLLLQDLQAHAKGLERAGCRIALIERRESAPGGADEFSKIEEYFKTQGVSACVADPREVEKKNGELVVKGETTDVLYRDFQLEEVVSIKTHGGSVEGIEAAFAQNKVVSTVLGEFDHKSLCELLTNPDYAAYFNPQEIRAARRRIPWTRLLEERRTADPEGKETDLLTYVRENREKLVLKPNRGYGGEGVFVGEAVTASHWDEAIQQAVLKPKTWVVQEKVPIARAPVMIVREQGRPKMEEQYLTLSVTATSRGVAFVGRSSSEPVVNISQGGGLVPVFLKG